MRHTPSFATLALLLAARSASALIYLPENTLESLLIRADAVAIATVTELDESKNTGILQVEDALMGDAKGAQSVTAVMLRIDTDKRKPRFAKADRIVVFLGPLKDGTRPVLHSQKLDSDAETKTMKACIAEITPVAQILADLADPKKPIALEPLHKALTSLVASKNAYTQILVGRLMATRLPGAVKPETCEDLVTTALASKRPELLKGAITWAAQFETPPAAITSQIEKLAKDAEDKSVREAAQISLAKQKPAPQ